MENKYFQRELNNYMKEQVREIVKEEIEKFIGYIFEDESHRENTDRSGFEVCK